MSEVESWNRNRAAILPITIVPAFLFLYGSFNGDDEDKVELNKRVALWWLIPGSFLALLIRTKTNSTAPPGWLLTLFAIGAFIMGIFWINFVSKVLVDIIVLIGFVTGLPTPLLGLTIIAWGNSLPDMWASLAMTKRGFGEMAITANIAAPIFNILVGTGVSSILKLSKTDDILSNKIPISIYHNTDLGERKINPVALIPLISCVSYIVILGINIVNAILNKFNLKYKITMISIVAYFGTICFLVVYSVINNVDPHEDV